jgi:hypothetical protein
MLIQVFMIKTMAKLVIASRCTPFDVVFVFKFGIWFHILLVQVHLNSYAQRSCVRGILLLKLNFVSHNQQ